MSHELLQNSPILPLDSGIRLEDVLEPEVTHFLSTDMNDLMSEVQGPSTIDESVVSVDPVIRLDGQNLNVSF